MSTSLHKRAVLWTVLVFAPASAQAHSVLPGAGAFSNGLLHPLLTPLHLLLILALGTWLGQRRPFAFAQALLAFSLAGGLGLSVAARTGAHLQAYLALFGLLAGLLVATECHRLRYLEFLLFAAGGLLLGLDSEAGADATGSTVILLAGTWVSLCMLLVNVAYYATLLPPRQAWARIGLRVAGSWIGAICLLMLAFSLRG